MTPARTRWLCLCLVLLPWVPAPPDAAGSGAERTAFVLPVRSLDVPIPAPALLMEPDHSLWVGVPETEVLLQRSPPLFSDGPLDDGRRPSLSVRLVRGNGGTGLVRLDWDDPTANIPPPAKRFAGAGEARIYKEHSGPPDAFADAVCVMVPERRGGSLPRPSLIMGDRQNPSELFFWRAGDGFRKLRSTGRATVERTGPVTPGRAVRRDGGWTAFVAIPALEAGTPLGFAVWDGARGQRDGLKYYSVWYELE